MLASRDHYRQIW